jgi:hypothetical protein
MANWEGCWKEATGIFKVVVLPQYLNEEAEEKKKIFRAVASFPTMNSRNSRIRSSIQSHQTVISFRPT